MQFTTALFLAFAAAASASTIEVQVGATGATPLVYTPEDITAEVGDIIEFSFNPKVNSLIALSHWPA
jgi:plastocyanin